MVIGFGSYANSLDVQPGSTAASASVSSKQTSSQKHASSTASSGAKETLKMINGIKAPTPGETGVQSTLLSATGGPFYGATAQQAAGAAGTMTFPEQEHQDGYPRTEERTQARMRECERMVAGVRNAGLPQ